MSPFPAYYQSLKAKWANNEKKLQFSIEPFDPKLYSVLLYSKHVTFDSLKKANLATSRASTEWADEELVYHFFEINKMTFLFQNNYVLLFLLSKNLDTMLNMMDYGRWASTTKLTLL